MGTVQIRLVDREEVLHDLALPRRTKWNEVIQHVKNAPEGKMVEVTLDFPAGISEEKRRVRSYNVAAILRQRAAKQGIRINVYRSTDSRKLYLERADRSH